VDINYLYEIVKLYRDTIKKNDSLDDRLVTITVDVNYDPVMLYNEKTKTRTLVTPVRLPINK
jgi:hypothetical protein